MKEATASWVNFLRDTVANTICSTAQSRVDSRSYLCQWGEYAFNEQGANIEQCGVHGTTEAVLALSRMLDAPGKPSHYTARFDSGYASLWVWWKSREHVDDFVRPVKLFPWIAALAKRPLAESIVTKCTKMVLDSQDASSGGWPFAIRGEDLPLESQKGQVWPTLLALQAVRGLSIDTAAGRKSIQRGEAFLRSAVVNDQVESDASLMAALGFLAYAFSFRANWLKDKDVEEVLSRVLRKRPSIALEPSFKYLFNPVGSTKKKASYCTVPVGILHLGVAMAASRRSSSFLDGPTRKHVKDQLHLLAECAYSPGVEGFRRLGHYRAAVELLTAYEAEICAIAGRHLILSCSEHRATDNSSWSTEVRSVDLRPRRPKSETRDYADILILTAADVEYSTAIEVAGIKADLLERIVTKGGIPFVDLGFEHCSVWLFQCKQGSIGPRGSFAQTEAAIRAVNPAAIVAVGIAFGLQREKQKMGDLLYADQIELYEVAREGTDVQIPRGDKPSATGKLTEWFRMAQHNWAADVEAEKRPKLHWGLVLTGEKLVDSPALVEKLKTHEPEAIGGEMEAAGVYSAAVAKKVDWHLVKGICDWGMGKDKKHQKIAAISAFDFVFHTLGSPKLAQLFEKTDRTTVHQE